jgi:hypothetical protein
VLCLIQQHSIIQYKQKYAQYALQFAKKKEKKKRKKLYEMLIWSKKEKFSL